MTYRIVLFYQYVPIPDPVALMNEQRFLCVKLGLKGRILIAKEGINATLEGAKEAIDKYCAEVVKIPGFENIHLKISEGTGTAFPKLSIKVRDEIVTTHVGDVIDPLRVTGTYLQPEELHAWIEQGEEFYIVDMRNDYEQRVGYFAGSILSEFQHFSDLPSIIPKLESLRGKKILTVCTGGVRCEKASAFLIHNGFDNVYQLYGGMVSYMEKYPNEDFKGKLYVFDGRVCMGFNTSEPEHEVVGMCELCNTSSERFINCADNKCHRHFICCDECFESRQGFCSVNCGEIVEMSIAAIGA